MLTRGREGVGRWRTTSGGFLLYHRRSPSPPCTLLSVRFRRRTSCWLDHILQSQLQLLHGLAPCVPRRLRGPAFVQTRKREEKEKLSMKRQKRRRRLLDMVSAKPTMTSRAHLTGRHLPRPRANEVARGARSRKSSTHASGVQSCARRTEEGPGGPQPPCGQP